MDFTKYVSILDSQALFFARSDFLGDPYEGATSHANGNLRPQIYRRMGIPEDQIPTHMQHSESARRQMYLNCWHMNMHESAGMWKLYSSTNEAVAIQSTYRRLHLALPDESYLGVVSYIDYETDWLPEGNIYWPFIHKRKSFQHEQELRAVIWKCPDPAKGETDEVLNSRSGIEIKVAIDYVIENLYISPTAPDWFTNLVVSVTRKYGYEFEVNQSILAKSPVY